MLRSRVIELAAAALQSESGTIEAIDILDSAHDAGGVVAKHLDIVVKFKEENIPNLWLFAKVSRQKSPIPTFSDELNARICKMETIFYLSVAPGLEKLAQFYGVKLPIAKLYAAVIENGICLIILENLVKKGFEYFPEMSDKSQQIGSPYLTKFLKELGKLQGVAALQSHILETPLDKLYPVVNPFLEMMGNMMKAEGIQDKFKFEIKKKAKPEEAEIFCRFSDHCAEIFDELSSGSYNCISFVHNDTWRNNILHKNDDIFLVDYQAWDVGPVALDLIRALSLGGCVDEYQPQKLKQHLESYLDGFRECWDAAGIDLPAVWSIENLLADIYKLAPLMITIVYNSWVSIFNIPLITQEFFDRNTKTFLYFIETFLDEKWRKLVCTKVD